MFRNGSDFKNAREAEKLGKVRQVIASLKERISKLEPHRDEDSKNGGLYQGFRTSVVLIELEIG